MQFFISYCVGNLNLHAVTVKKVVIGSFRFSFIRGILLVLCEKGALHFHFLTRVLKTSITRNFTVDTKVSSQN